MARDWGGWCGWVGWWGGWGLDIKEWAHPQPQSCTPPLAPLYFSSTASTPADRALFWHKKIFLKKGCWKYGFHAVPLFFCKYVTNWGGTVSIRKGSIWNKNRFWMHPITEKTMFEIFLKTHLKWTAQAIALDGWASKAYTLGGVVSALYGMKNVTAVRSNSRRRNVPWLDCTMSCYVFMFQRLCFCWRPLYFWPNSRYLRDFVFLNSFCWNELETVFDIFTKSYSPLNPPGPPPSAHNWDKPWLVSSLFDVSNNVCI